MGRLLVVALIGLVLLGVSALVALMGMEKGPPGASMLPMGTTPADLPEPDGRGAELVARYCRSCHSVPLPILHTAEEWPDVVAEMRSRMMSRVMAPLPLPTSNEHRELVSYFQRHARGSESASAGK